MAYFPMFVDIENKKCVVIGGGNVAKRKAETLLKFGANVTVIAPEIKCEFKGCNVIKRKFNKNDVDGAFMVVAAANDRNANKEAAEICRSRGIYVNAADSSDESSFIFGALIKKDNMVIAVNSGENNPAKSKRVKEDIMELLDKRLIRIGTRKSGLAKIQTDIVAKLINKADSSIRCEIVEISTAGDENRDKSLSEFGGKGAFTGELERAVIDGKIDIAVHSGKDLPVELAEGLEIIAVPKRERANDVIVSMNGRKLNDNSVLGTGSVRRSRQVDYKTRDIRGNVETRLNKMENGEYDGVVLAYAGLKRLGLIDSEKYDFKIMDINEICPAPCQGIIAVEGRKDGKFNDIIRKINDEDTYLSFLAERRVVTELGMGCHFPIGVYTEINDGVMCMKGTYCGANKKKSIVLKDKKENGGDMAVKMAYEIKRSGRG